MEIAGYSKKKRLLICYNLSLGTTHTNNNVTHKYLTSLTLCNVEENIGCLYSAALFLENRHTCYDSAGAIKAANRLLASKLFGRFETGAHLAENDITLIQKLSSSEQYFAHRIRDVFRNRGRTDWGFKTLGHGAIRLYPSNGGIHSLRPIIILKDTTIEYYPHSDRITASLTSNLQNGGRLEIIMELDRVLEKYSDAGAFVAIYLELGHMLSTLNHHLPKCLNNLTLTACRSRDNNMALCIARIEL